MSRSLEEQLKAHLLRLAKDRVRFEAAHIEELEKCKDQLFKSWTDFLQTDVYKQMKDSQDLGLVTLLNKYESIDHDIRHLLDFNSDEGLLSPEGVIREIKLRVTGFMADIEQLLSGILNLGEESDDIINLMPEAPKTSTAASNQSPESETGSVAPENPAVATVTSGPSIASPSTETTKGSEVDEFADVKESVVEAVRQGMFSVNKLLSISSAEVRTKINPLLLDVSETRSALNEALAIYKSDQSSEQNLESVHAIYDEFCHQCDVVINILNFYLLKDERPNAQKAFMLGGRVRKLSDINNLIEGAVSLVSLDDQSREAFRREKGLILDRIADLVREKQGLDRNDSNQARIQELSNKIDAGHDNLLDITKRVLTGHELSFETDTSNDKASSAPQVSTSTLTSQLPTPVSATLGTPSTGPTAPGLPRTPETIYGELQQRAAALRRLLTELQNNSTSDSEWSKYVQINTYEFGDIERAIKVIDLWAQKNPDEITEELNGKLENAISLIESRLENIKDEKEKILKTAATNNPATQIPTSTTATASHIPPTPPGSTTIPPVPTPAPPVPPSVTSAPIPTPASKPAEPESLVPVTLEAKNVYRTAENEFKTAYREYLLSQGLKERIGGAWQELRGSGDGTLPPHLIELEKRAIAAAEIYKAKVREQVEARTQRQAAAGLGLSRISDYNSLKSAFNSKFVQRSHQEQVMVESEVAEERSKKFASDYPEIAATAKFIKSKIPKSRLARLTAGLVVAAGIGAGAGVAAAGATTVAAIAGAASLGSLAGSLRFVVSTTAGMGAGFLIDRYQTKKVASIEAELNQVLLNKSELDLVAARKAVRLASADVDRAKFKRRAYVMLGAAAAGFGSRGAISLADGLFGTADSTPENQTESQPVATPLDSTHQLTGSAGEPTAPDSASASVAGAVASTPAEVNEIPKFEVPPHPVKSGDNLSTILLNNVRVQFDSNPSLFAGVDRSQLMNLIYTKFPELTDASAPKWTLTPEDWRELGIKSGDPHKIGLNDTINVSALLEKLSDKDLASGASGQSFTTAPVIKTGMVPIVRNEVSTEHPIKILSQPEKLVSVEDYTNPNLYTRLRTNFPAEAIEGATEQSRTDLIKAYEATNPPALSNGVGNQLNTVEYKAYLARNGIEINALNEQIKSKAMALENRTYGFFGMLTQRYDSPFEKLSGLTLGELAVMQIQANGSAPELQRMLEARAGSGVVFNPATIQAWGAWLDKAQRMRDLPTNESTSLGDLFGRYVAQQAIQDKFEQTQAAKLK